MTIKSRNSKKNDRTIVRLINALEKPGLGENAREALKKFGPACIPEVIKKIKYRIKHPIKKGDGLDLITAQALSTIGETRCDESIKFLNNLLDNYMSEIPNESFDPTKCDWKYRNVDFFHLLDCMVKQQDKRAIPHIRKARNFFPENYTDYKICQIAIGRIKKGRPNEGYLPLESLEIAFPSGVMMNALSGGKFGFKDTFDEEYGEYFGKGDENRQSIGRSNGGISKTKHDKMRDINNMTGRKKTATRGKCNLCHLTFDKRVMSRHLENHLKERSDDFGYFHLLVQDKYTPYYWLHLQVPANFSLKKLDDYLRDIWLECCGHLSVFKIGDSEYYSHPDQEEYGDRDMKVAVSKVLGVGDFFKYEYDFGTTSELVLKVVSVANGKNISKSIKLLARNEAPIMKCGKCGNKATQICSECAWDENRELFCRTDANRHKHDQEMFLPIVNSPRVGMCGYTG
ncbi:hypothetical protein HZB78_02820 [Candidatus Collierbacteria bacterium]|nr:hypothetical protein [Candidatus Collierbacteria bacterium]